MKSSCSFVFPALALLLAGCALPRAAPRRFEFRSLQMGVEARVVLFASDSTRAFQAARAAFGRIAELDRMMSDYRDDSELMRLSQVPAGQPTAVSRPLLEVLQTAQQLAQLSSGAFDVTAGPLVLLWREARRSGRLPPPDSLRVARAAVGWRQLQVDPRAATVRLLRPGMRLDLGGIAKGYAADEALRVLEAEGFTRALVELGGDIVVGAPPPGRPGWEIRLADPAGAPPVVELAHAAISSSGDAAQFVVIDGVRYSHIVDPRSGSALRDRVAATVIAPRGLLSDGLATLLSVLGPEEAPRFMEMNFPGITAYVRRLPAT